MDPERCQNTVAVFLLHKLWLPILPHWCGFRRQHGQDVRELLRFFDLSDLQPLFDGSKPKQSKFH